MKLVALARTMALVAILIPQLACAAISAAGSVTGLRIDLVDLNVSDGISPSTQTFFKSSKLSHYYSGPYAGGQNIRSSSSILQDASTSASSNLSISTSYDFATFSTSASVSTTAPLGVALNDIGSSEVYFTVVLSPFTSAMFTVHAFAMAEGADVAGPSFFSTGQAGNNFQLLDAFGKYLDGASLTTALRPTIDGTYSGDLSITRSNITALPIELNFTIGSFVSANQNGISAIPEPSSGMLMGGGLIALLFGARSFRRGGTKLSNFTWPVA